MTEYKLMYFNGRGLGELTRYIFAVAGQDYEDHRIEFGDWSKYKEDTLFGQLPVLVITENSEETKLSQSGTIARYLARRFGFAGKDDLEQARAEMILDHFNDLQGHFRKAFQEKDPVLKAQEFKKFSQIIPDHLATVEKILETEKTPYLAGDELTSIYLNKKIYLKISANYSNLLVADLALAVALDRYSLYLGNILEKFPLIKALNQKINCHPKLSLYKATRPSASF